MTPPNKNNNKNNKIIYIYIYIIYIYIKYYNYIMYSLNNNCSSDFNPSIHTNNYNSTTTDSNVSNKGI